MAANWQWHRHFERQALNVELEKSIKQDPLLITDLSQIKEDFAEYKTLEFTGEFVGSPVWWRKQSLDGVPGFVGLEAFKMTNGEQIVVALGWSQYAVSMTSPSAEQIKARLRFIDDFAKDPDDLPVGQTNSPSTILPTNDDYYFELLDPSVENLAELPLPEITAGPHLGYVGQWILIAIFAVSVYIIALRNLPNNELTDAKQEK